MPLPSPRQYQPSRRSCASQKPPTLPPRPASASLTSPLFLHLANAAASACPIAVASSSLVSLSPHRLILPIAETLVEPGGGLLQATRLIAQGAVSPTGSARVLERADRTRMIEAVCMLKVMNWKLWRDVGEVITKVCGTRSAVQRRCPEFRLRGYRRRSCP
jgi:hypothetical protein